jgi:hypothetical protein
VWHDMREEGILPNASLYFTLLMSLKRVRSAASLLPSLSLSLPRSPSFAHARPDVMMLSPVCVCVCVTGGSVQRVLFVL